MSELPYALRHEEDVDGQAAAIFADVRRRLSFTPALFKALAADPEALERAWLQARALIDDSRYAATTEQLREAARVPGTPLPSPAVRAAVAPFVAELPGMLLIVSSLGLTLDGRLARRPAPPLALTAAELPPEPVVPEARGEQPLYPAIRALYATEHVPSLYRSLAAHGLLEEAWPLAGALLTGDDGAARIERLAAEGEAAALAFPEAACFDVERARALLDQFRRALPRNLMVAVALSGSP